MLWNDPQKWKSSLAWLMIFTLIVSFFWSGSLVQASTGPFHQGDGYQPGAYHESAVQPTGYNWTRQSPFIGSQVALKRWELNVNGSFVSPATIAADGTIYAGASILYAIKPDGSVKWTFGKEGSFYYSSPAIGMDGTIYVGAYSGGLYALNPDGTQKWVFSTESGITSSPAIGSDGALYVLANDGKLYAIHSDGSEKWVYETGMTTWENTSSPAIDKGGVIYFGGGSTDYQLYAVHPDGSLKWSFTATDPVRSSPVIGDDGTIYIGTDNYSSGHIYAIHPDGTEKWAHPTAWGAASAAIDSDGTIYAGTYFGYLYAMNPDGTEKWMKRFPASFESAPVIGADGTLYTATNDYYLMAINTEDGSEKWSYITGNSGSAPTIGSDGTIYTGTLTGKFLAIGGNPADLPIDHISLDAVSKELLVGTTHSTQVSAVYTDRSQQTVTPHSTFKSSDPTVVTINAGGTMTGVNPGKANIIATYGGHKATLTVTVSEQLIEEGDFDQNQGQGGFQSGAYDIQAAFPTPFNWTRQSRFNISSYPRLLWEYQTADDINDSPVVGADGTIYFSSMDRKLYALNSNGTVKWKTPLFSEMGTPVIAADGTLYIGADDGLVYAIDPNGKEKWAFNTKIQGYSQNRPSTPPVIGADGTIYIGSSAGLFFAINPDGSEKWSTQLNARYMQSSPAIAADGTIYVTGSNSLYAINPSGTLKWSQPTGSGSSSPVIGSDQTIYTLGKAFNPDGSLKWEVQPDTQYSSMISGPALGSDGTIYFGSTDTKLYAITPNGSKKWVFQTDGLFIRDPLISADGSIYIISNTQREAYVQAIRPDGTKKWSMYLPWGISSSPAVGSDGTIYVGSIDNKLYAINGSLSDEETTVSIPDAQLDTLIREQLQKPSGELTKGDLASLTTLYADYKGITDLTGLEHALNLQFMDLNGNQVKDIQALKGLSQPQTRWIWLTGNPLNVSSTQVIDQLKAQGIDVQHDPIPPALPFDLNEDRMIDLFDLIHAAKTDPSSVQEGITHYGKTN